MSDVSPIDVTALLAQWRAVRSAEVLLRCGIKVTLRKVTPLELAAQGKIPLPLHGQVKALLNGTQQMSIEVERVAEWAGVINLVVKAAVLSPPIADEPSETAIGIDEIPIDDRLLIWNWAQQEAAPAATFLS